MRTVLAGLALVSLGACATTPAGPKPCTPEWTASIKEPAFAGFAERHRGQLDTLKALADGFAKGDDNAAGKANKVAALQVAFAGVGMLKLAGQFSNETAKPVRSRLSQCGAPPTTGAMFADLLRQEQFPPVAAAAVEQFSLWMSVGK